VRVAADREPNELAFFDVAACLAGVTPAWTGGPLMWAWTERNAVAASFDTDTMVAWTRLQPALGQACA
jgi:3-hydroxyacyl-CoA dehydrogenase/enoyl-CoA hydratase/3-hydroxybutyryl-CoA epimerase